MNILKVIPAKKMFVHAETGDPVFSYHFDKEYVGAKWHPAMKQIYGDRLNDSVNLLRAEKILDNTPQKLGKRLTEFYNILSNKNAKTDELRTKRIVADNGEFHHEVYSNDGQKIATLKPCKYSHFKTLIEIPEEHSQSWDLYRRKKYIMTNNTSSYDLAMESLADWDKVKEQKPSFVGINFDGNTKTYSTHLPDDIAAEKYTNHVTKINKIINRQHTIEKLSPTDYKIHIPLTNSVHEHTINVKNGIVTHTENRSLGKVHYDSQPLN